ncbi:MAG: CFI-box-CTERM domain-containing protein [Bacteroidota bacterium]
MVPCTSSPNNPHSSKPLLYPFGYYDQEGQLHSLQETTQLLHNFVANMIHLNPDITYKEATRGSFFGRDTLLQLMKDEKCANVQLYFGWQDKRIKAVLAPLDCRMNRFSQVYLEYANPCPPFCGGGECLATTAVSLASDEKELDLYRQFRDEILLNVEGGGRHYEMYYFISPLIATFISQKENQEEILTNLYVEKIAPFKQLILDKQYDQAIRWLQVSFDELAREYQVEIAEEDVVI